MLDEKQPPQSFGFDLIFGIYGKRCRPLQNAECLHNAKLEFKKKYLGILYK